MTLGFLRLDDFPTNWVNPIALLVVLGAAACVLFGAFKIPFRRGLLIWLRAGSVAVMLLAGGRLLARHQAAVYGGNVIGAMNLLSYSGFADTKCLEGWLADPAMSSIEKRAALGGYGSLINDLKTGMVYFSSQASLPSGERFKSPPKLGRLHLDTTDRSKDGVLNGTLVLIRDYRARL